MRKRGSKKRRALQKKPGRRERRTGAIRKALEKRRQTPSERSRSPSDNARAERHTVKNVMNATGAGGSQGDPLKKRKENVQKNKAEREGIRGKRPYRQNTAKKRDNQVGGGKKG